jgi:sodium/pantothenate symporter
VWLSRGVIAVIGVASVLLALNPPDLLAVFVGIGNYAFVSAVFAPIVFGMFWDRANSKGALVSMLLGPAVYIYIFLSGIEPNPFVAGFYGLLSGIIVMIVASYATTGRTELVSRREVVVDDD